jgi:hypothetical protein
MLILPPGHHREVSASASAARRFSGRDRWLMGFGGALTVVLVVGLIVAFTSVQKTSGHGCIDVSAATVIGGSELYRCGASARALCEQPLHRGDMYKSFDEALVLACRKASLPVPHVGLGASGP